MTNLLCAIRKLWSVKYKSAYAAIDLEKSGARCTKFGIPWVLFFNSVGLGALLGVRRFWCLSSTMLGSDWSLGKSISLVDLGKTQMRKCHWCCSMANMWKTHGKTKQVLLPFVLLIARWFIQACNRPARDLKIGTGSLCAAALCSEICCQPNRTPTGSRGKFECSSWGLVCCSSCCLLFAVFAKFCFCPVQQWAEFVATCRGKTWTILVTVLTLCPGDS